MKKITLSIATIIMLTLGVGSQANAQYWSVALTGGVGIPMGSFGEKPTLDFTNGNIVATATTGFGLGLQARYHLDDNMAVGINVGYMNFNTQLFPSSNDQGTFGAVPLMAAFDYFFMTDNFRPYVGLEAGYMSTAVEYTDAPAVSVSGAGFAFGPVLGMVLNFTDNVGLIANVKYTYGLNEHKFDITKVSATKSDVGMPGTQFLSVNAGLNFTFGK